MLEKQLWKDMQDKQLFAMFKARASTRHNAKNVRVIRGEPRSSRRTQYESPNNHDSIGHREPIPPPDYPPQSHSDQHSNYIENFGRIMTADELRDDLSDLYPLRSPYETVGDTTSNHSSRSAVNIFQNSVSTQESQDAAPVPISKSHRTSEIIWT